VALALRHSPSFRRTIQSLLVANSNWRVARQLWDLSLFGSIGRSGNAETTDSRDLGLALSYLATTGAELSVTAELARLDSEETEHAIQATLRQPLLEGSWAASAAYERLRAARNAYRAELLSFFDSRQSLLEQVVADYFGAWRLRQEVAIQESGVRRAERTMERTQKLLEAGESIDIDLTRAKLNLARAQVAQVSARRAQRQAADSLLALLGLQVGADPELVTAVPREAAEIGLEAAVAQALKLRPELRLSDLSIENLEAALHIRRNARLPSLDLVGGLQRTANGLAEDSWNLGLTISVPIGSRPLTEAARQAEWALLVARREREDLKQQVVLEVRRQVWSAEEATKRLEIDSGSVEVAQQELHIAERLVEEGLASNFDLVAAQEKLTAAESSVLESSTDLYLAALRLRRATGLDLAQGLPAAEAGPLGGAPTGEPPAKAAQERAEP
jgi:outer membrane protein TolC